MSLVDYVKKGFSLNDKGTQQACALVPKPDGSCSGFTESIVPLITSSNEALANSSLWVLVLFTPTAIVLRTEKAPFVPTQLVSDAYFGDVDVMFTP
ncbi:hypothetical protein BLNAU_7723 [Blattamonas nauphoetae]|uniref:Uncharacterized protein n=1 Tax=Blattamonas nauphoetae TaxID=2049346 RepID=A0ABQ9Y0T5_9EUKA|nr:hypothetical protein BLNAU_7723 [Blattamonas nauphoetae]